MKCEEAHFWLDQVTVSIDRDLWGRSLYMETLCILMGNPSVAVSIDRDLWGCFLYLELAVSEQASYCTFAICRSYLVCVQLQVAASCLHVQLLLTFA